MLPPNTLALTILFWFTYYSYSFYFNSLIPYYSHGILLFSRFTSIIPQMPLLYYPGITANSLVHTRPSPVRHVAFICIPREPWLRRPLFLSRIFYDPRCCNPRADRQSGNLCVHYSGGFAKKIYTHGAHKFPAKLTIKK